MPKLIQPCVMLASVLLMPGAVAAAADAAVPRFIEAQQTFEQSLAGDQAATGSSIERFQALVDDDPRQPLYLAYLGSAYTLKARDAWMPWTRLNHVEKGLDMIDRALRMQGLRGSVVGVETRLVAISTFMQVPAFLHRRQEARTLMRDTLRAPAFAAAPPMVKGRLWLWAAELARDEQDGEAERGHLRQAAEVLPPGRFADRAHRLLAELGGSDGVAQGLRQ